MRWVWKSRFVECQNDSEKYRKWTYFRRISRDWCEWTLRVSKNTGDWFLTRFSFFMIFSNFFLMPVTLTAGGGSENPGWDWYRWKAVFLKFPFLSSLFVNLATLLTVFGETCYSRVRKVIPKVTWDHFFGERMWAIRLPTSRWWSMMDMNLGESRE